MAITRTSRGPAKAISCIERPAYIGGFRTSFSVPADFDDCFLQIIVGTHPDNYVVQAGDYLQYQIFPIASAAATMQFGLDLKFVAGPWLSDAPTLDDAGDSVIADRAAYEGTWHPVAVSLDAFAGLVIDQVVAHFEDDDSGDYSWAIRAAYITNAGTIVKTIFAGLSTGLPTTALGVVNGNPASKAVELLLDADGPSYPIRTVTTGTSESILPEDVIVINNSSSGAMTFNLPDAGVFATGKVYIFRNSHASNNLTLDGFSSQTIDGSTTKTLTPGQFAEIVRSSATTWATIG